MKFSGCGWDTKQKFLSGKSEFKIMRCVKPLQYLLVEGPSELAIYKAVINGVCFTTVNTITIIFYLKSIQLFSSYDNSVNKFAILVGYFLFTTSDLTEISLSA